VTATPIPAFRYGSSETRFGAVEFTGGLELASPAGNFGGWSGIRLMADGARFLAVSDDGAWLAGRIARDGDGAPQALADTVMGLLLDKAARKSEADAEALAISGNTAFIAFERRHRLAKLPLRDGVPAGAAKTLRDLSALKLASNRGIEALAVFPKGSPRAGALLAISEESLNRNGDIRGFILGKGRPAEFAVARSDDFAATDADFLPDGDLVLLERHFSLRRGPAMRLRRIAPAELQAGKTAQGDVLMTANLSHRIDNMEGLAVSALPDGSARLTLISDDNFSRLQRTLLLEFRLAA